VCFFGWGWGGLVFLVFFLGGGVAVHSTLLLDHYLGHKYPGTLPLHPMSYALLYCMLFSTMNTAYPVLLLSPWTPFALGTFLAPFSPGFRSFLIFFFSPPPCRFLKSRFFSHFRPSSFSFPFRCPRNFPFPQVLRTRVDSLVP